MNQHKRFIYVFFAILLPALMILPAVNGFIDSARVLSRDYVHHYKERQPNYNFLKMANFLEHRDEYDSLIFGSSRVRFGFDPRSINRILGGRWYKMEYPGGAPRDHLYNLKTLLLKGVKPERVILTLDDFDLYHFSDRENDYFYKPYPRNVGEWLDFYHFYLFKKLTSGELGYIRERSEMKASERITEPYGFLIKRSPEKQDKYLLSLDPRGWKEAVQTPEPVRLINDIEKFIRLCADNGIQLAILFTPRNYKTFYAHDFEALADFKKRLARLHPFYDFTVIDDYTMDNRYWSDASHFFANVGEVVIGTMREKSRIPGEFGTLVDEDNVDLHLERVFSVAVANLKHLLLKDHKMIVHPVFFKASHSLSVVKGEHVEIESLAGEWILRTGDKAGYITLACGKRPPVNGGVVSMHINGNGGVIRHLPPAHSSDRAKKEKYRISKKITIITFYADAEELRNGVRLQMGNDRQYRLKSLTLGDVQQ